jgi:hypothetical protein
MKPIIQEAFRVAILTEKNSYDLYRNAGAMVPEGSGKEVLEQLAHDELKLIEEMLIYSPDTLVDLLMHPNDQHISSFDGYSKESPERRLFNHLRVALLDKHSCIDRYTTYLKTFRDPEVCRVFELALSISRRQFGLIAQEYRKADQRVHRPGSFKRAKRIHLKVGIRPTPNKHSELFLSLLDSGRHPHF